MDISDEQKKEWAKTYESHYENQFNIANAQLKDERNKRILKEGEIAQLKDLLSKIFLKQVAKGVVEVSVSEYAEVLEHRAELLEVLIKTKEWLKDMNLPDLPMINKALITK